MTDNSWYPKIGKCRFFKVIQDTNTIIFSLNLIIYFSSIVKQVLTT